MKTIECGNIDEDDVMNWCIKHKLYQQKDQFNCGYNWIRFNENFSDVVETNSDHFLNGVRCAVKDGLCKPEDIDILFSFEKEDVNYEIKDGEVCTLRMMIDKYGYIDNWPAGFFDQWDVALSYLLDLSV